MRHTATLLALVLAALTPFAATVADEETDLPEDFLFGVATASYQIEGAWNEDGKGENIWDHMLHEHPEYTDDHKNGDVADDSYHKYKEDVQLIKSMNMNVYRFSISWARVLPKGDLSEINQKGIDYYNNLINELKENGIEPVVTMYHWDLPYELQKMGGWTNREIAYYFEDYADLLFKNFGDRVKYWITFNEPPSFCRGYAGEDHRAPAVDKPGVGDYLCGHTLLLGHAYAYHLYEKQYKSEQKGKVGITLNSHYAYPKNKDSQDDKDAADRSLQFYLGWFANPIFSTDGDYPAVMRQRIDANSKKEGLGFSRLPKFTDEEIELLKGSADFLGLNHYSSKIAEDAIPQDVPVPSRTFDSGIVETLDESWPGSGSSWLKVVPEGFRDILVWVKENYNSPDIMITENGFSDRDGDTNDLKRVDYYRKYLKQMVKAMKEDNVSIFGYTAWSLMDNFEWARGYTERFGLHYVDYDSDVRTRIPKASAVFLAEVAKTHNIPDDTSE